MFSKHTSKAASACDVKTVRCSPTTSLGLPYSFPAASEIYLGGSSALMSSTLDSSWALGTYVHVDLHPVVPVAVDGSCDYNQRVLGDKVADASL